MKNIKKGISLRIKLIVAFAAMAIVPLLLANIIALRTAQRTIIKTVFEHNHSLAVKIAGEIDQMFAEKIRVLKIAADNPDIGSMDPAKLVPALRPLPAHQPELLMAIILSAEGDLLARSDGKQVKANYQDRAYFHTAKRTGETTISDVLVSKTTGKLDIGIAEPIKNPDRSLRGLLVVGVSLEKIIDRIAKTRIGTTGYVFVVNKSGKLLMHPDPALVSNPPDLSALPPVRAVLAGKSGAVEYEFNGEKVLAGYSYVPTTGWGLIVQQPLEEAMFTVTTLRNTNIIILMATILVAAIVLLSLAQIIFKPIALLTAATGKVADGDLSVQARIESSDEIGALAAAFNRMTTQLRAREEALQKSQERYRRIVDTSNEGIVVLDEQRRITFVNARLTELLKYREDEMIGQKIESFLFAEDFPDHTQRMHDRYLGVAEQYERRWRDRNGETVWTIISATPIFTVNQQFEGAFAMVTDITERKRAELELEQAKEAAEASNAAKSLFLANMSHELRTPMTGILGMLELALGEDIAPVPHGYLEMSLTSAQSLLRILDDILDITRIEAGKLSLVETPFSLPACVQAACEFFQTEARRKGIELHVSLAEELPTTVCGDQVRLRQVLINIVGNAVKFTARGKVELRVIAGPRHADDQREIVFTVADTGIGIPEAKQRDLFQAFSQADSSHSRSFGGTGLGLAICREIVQLMGGEMSFTSEPGVGSTFSFTVPLAEVGSETYYSAG